MELTMLVCFAVMKPLQDADWSHWSDREIAKRAAGMNLFGACDPLKSCDLDHVLHPEQMIAW